MTPDELPAEMEAVVLDLLTDLENVLGKSNLSDADFAEFQREINALRALLKAYQERGRALERLANKDNEFDDEVQTIARAALTGEDTGGTG